MTPYIPRNASSMAEMPTQLAAPRVIEPESGVISSAEDGAPQSSIDATALAPAPWAERANGQLPAADVGLRSAPAAGIIPVPVKPAAFPDPASHTKTISVAAIEMSPSHLASPRRRDPSSLSPASNFEAYSFSMLAGEAASGSPWAQIVSAPTVQQPLELEGPDPGDVPEPSVFVPLASGGVSPADPVLGKQTVQPSLQASLPYLEKGSEERLRSGDSLPGIQVRAVLEPQVAVQVGPAPPPEVTHGMPLIRPASVQPPGPVGTEKAAVGSSEPRSIQVRIGTIEVRTALQAAPPAPSPAAAPQGFDDYAAVRNYANWEWY